MAITERTLGGTPDAFTTAGLTVAASPTGMVQDDIMVALLASIGSAAAMTHSAPDGTWTLIGTQQTAGAGASATRTSLWRKTAGASEAGPYTFTAATANRRITLSIRAFTGVDTSTPVEANDQASSGTGTATSVTHPTMTSGGAGRLRLLGSSKAAATGAGTTINTPSGYTETADLTTNSGSAVNVNHALHYLEVGSGATGTQVVDSPDATAQTWAGIELLLAPAAVGGTPVTLAEVGTAADTVQAAAAVSLADSAAAVDTLQAAVAVPVAESAAAAEVRQVSATLPLADSGTAADQVTAGQPKTLTDQGVVADGIQPSAQVPLADQTAATDQVQVAVAALLPDSGAAVDRLQPAAVVTLPDSGIAADQVQVGVALTLPDSGQASEQLQAAKTVPLADQGTATDTLKVPVPQQVANCHLWLRPEGITALTNGAGIATWPDESGFANDPVQATGTAQPTKADNAINNLPAALFDPAASQRLRSTTADVLTAFNNVSGATMFAVCAPNLEDSTDRQVIYWSTSTVGSRRAGLVKSNPSPGNMAMSGRRLDTDTSGTVFETTAATSGVWAAHCGVLDYANATASIYRNGILEAGPITFQTAGNTSATNSVAVGIGSASGVAGSGFWPGHIAEIIVYNRVLTGTERDLVTNYLIAKYNLTVETPKTLADSGAGSDTVRVTAAAPLGDTGAAGDALDVRQPAWQTDTFQQFGTAESWADSSTHGQWFVQFGGVAAGNGVGTEVDGSTVLFEKPDAPTTLGVTHASLVTSTVQFGGNVDFSVDVKTVQQLRQNDPPNAWETAWLVWAYTDNAHFYYFALKTNGIELGKRHPAYAGGQRFLWTAATPTLSLNTWNRIRVIQDGNVLSVFVDGTELVLGAGGPNGKSFVDLGGSQADSPYLTGRVGLYNEDAWVRFDNVLVNAVTPNDSGTAADQLQVTVAVPLNDQGQGGGVLQVTAAVPVADSAAAADSLTVNTGAGGPVQYRAAGALGNNAVAATTLAVPYPAGVQLGDALVVGMSLSAGTATTPTGWTLVKALTTPTNPHVFSFLRLAVQADVDASAASGSLAVTTTSVLSSGRMLAYYGVDQTTPQDVAATEVQNAVAALTVVIPAVAGGASGRALVEGGGANSSTVTSTVPGPFTEVADFAVDAGGTAGKSGFLGHHLNQDGTSEGVTVTLSASRENAGWLLALRPVAGPGGETAKTLSDAATGSEVFQVTASVPLADTATAADSLVLYHVLTDSGTVADQVQVTAQAPLGDAGVAYGDFYDDVYDDVYGSPTDRLSVAAQIPFGQAGTAADSLTVAQGVVPKTLPDSGAGADVLLVAVQVSLVEQGGVADQLQVAALLTLVDAAAATDSLTVAQGIPKTLAEAGAATDVLSVAVQMALADSGAATDQLQVAAQVLLADQGAATDTLSVQQGAAKTLPDSATATDTVQPAAQAALADSGTGADQVQPAAAVPLTQQGQATDILQTTQAGAPNLFDQGIAADTLQAAAAVPVADTGLAADSLVLTQTRTLTDSATDADSVQVAAQITLSDAGAATDTLQAAAAATLADQGAAAETTIPTVAVILADQTAAADQVQVSQAAAPQLTDSGQASDQLLPAAQTPLAETATTADQLTTNQTAAPQLPDSGQAADQLLVTQAKLLTDTATATDQVAVNVGRVLADQATTADTLRPTALAVLTAGATAADQIALAALAALSDHGQAADAMLVATVAYWITTTNHEPLPTTISREPLPVAVSREPASATVTRKQGY